MKSLKLRSQLLALAVINAVLTPCAFDAPGGTEGGGTPQRVQEPSADEQTSLSASNAQEPSTDEGAGSIHDEAQDGGPVGGSGDSEVEQPS